MNQQTINAIKHFISVKDSLSPSNYTLETTPKIKISLVTFIESKSGTVVRSHNDTRDIEIHVDALKWSPEILFFWVAWAVVVQETKGEDGGRNFVMADHLALAATIKEYDSVDLHPLLENIYQVFKGNPIARNVKRFHLMGQRFGIAADKDIITEQGQGDSKYGTKSKLMDLDIIVAVKDFIARKDVSRPICSGGKP